MNRPINQAMTLGQWGGLLFLSVVWGGSFIFTAVVVKEIPPLTMVAVRLLLAAALLAGIIFATGIKMPRDLRTWGFFAVMGTLNNVVPFALFAWGQTHVTASLASILNAAQPLFTVFLAHVLTRDEKMTGGKLVGAAIGLAGVAAIVGIDALEGFSTDVLAQLACLAATLLYAYTSVFARRFAGLGVAPLAVATGQLATGGVLALVAALLFDQPWTLSAPSLIAVGALAGQAVLSTALAYIVFFGLIAKAGATNAGLVTFLNPVTAVGIGALLLGERLEPTHALGMVVIAVGLAFIDGRPLAALRRATSR
jgi:drug/metabolite transporter (DMT)-like permease